MFDPLHFAKKMDEQLIGKSVGYQYAVYEGETLSSSGAGGYAVVVPNAPVANTPMTTSHQMHVMSMSKTLTAVAFMRAMEILNAAGSTITIESKIAPYLPLDWAHGPHVNETTFKHLLTHTSGLLSAPAPLHDGNLFKYLKQTIANGGDEAHWQKVHYEDCNFSLLRILIANMLYGVGVSSDRFPQHESPEHRTARYYFDFVRDQVLSPVGLSHVSFVANSPGQLTRCYNFNDTSKYFKEFTFTWYLLRTGPGHWVMSAKEFAHFIAGLSNGKIVSAVLFKQMKDHQLGMWRNGETTGGLNWNHNGGFGTDDGAGAAADWMILPNGFTATCFVNSIGGLKKTPYEVIRNAFNAAWLSPATTNVAPAATSLGNRIYVVIKGDDNQIYLNQAVDGQPCSGWMEVEGGGSTKLAPAAASLGNRIYVFVKHINNNVICVNSAVAGQPFDGFGFGWSELPDATTDVPPAAASLGNRLYVFAKGINDKQIYFNSALDGQALDGNGWSAISGVTTDMTPAAASLGNRLYVFAKGLNNRIYVNSALDGQAMSNWKEVEGNATTDAAPAAASLGGRVYVFAKGIGDKRIYMNSALSGQPFDGWGSGWSEVQW